jgi:hypothetical protein
MVLTNADSCSSSKRRITPLHNPLSRTLAASSKIPLARPASILASSSLTLRPRVRSPPSPSPLTIRHQSGCTAGQTSGFPTWILILIHAPIGKRATVARVWSSLSTPTTPRTAGSQRSRLAPGLVTALRPNVNLTGTLSLPQPAPVGRPTPSVWAVSHFVSPSKCWLLLSGPCFSSVPV